MAKLKFSHGCCCTEEKVCWHRYSNTASTDLGASAPTPLGGPTEDPDNAEQYSQFWDDRTSGQSHPHDTTKISITGTDAMVINTVEVDKELSRLEVQFTELDDGSKPRIYFDWIDDDNYCYTEFECHNEEVVYAMYRVLDGELVGKDDVHDTALRCKLNHYSGHLAFDGTQTLTLGLSLCRGVFLATWKATNIDGLDKDDTASAFKINGELFVPPEARGRTSGGGDIDDDNDYDDQSGVTVRPLELGTEYETALPLLAGDTALRMVSGRWGVGGTGPFEIELIDAYNTVKDVPAGQSHVSECPPDTTCDGLITERPLKWGLGGTGVVESGKQWIRCSDSDTKYQLTSPGGAYSKAQEVVSFNDVNGSFDAEWKPNLGGTPHMCHWESEYFNPNYYDPDLYRVDSRVTNETLDYHPCTTTVTEGVGGGEITAIIDIESGPNIVANLIGGGSNSAVADTFRMNNPVNGTSFSSQILPAYWKPSDAEGQPLAFASGFATSAASGYLDYTRQQLTLGEAVFQDSNCDTFTAGPSVHTAPATAVIDVAFIAGTKTATVNVIDRGATAVAAAHYASLNIATVSVSTNHASASATATNAPIKTATVSVTDAPATSIAVATFSPGTHTASVVVSNNHASASATATFAPKRTATADVTDAPATSSVVATFSPGTHAATVSVSTSAATALVNAEVLEQCSMFGGLYILTSSSNGGVISPTFDSQGNFNSLSLYSFGVINGVFDFGGAFNPIYLSAGPTGYYPSARTGRASLKCNIAFSNLSGQQCILSQIPNGDEITNNGIAITYDGSLGDLVIKISYQNTKQIVRTFWSPLVGVSHNLQVNIDPTDHFGYVRVWIDSIESPVSYDIPGLVIEPCIQVNDLFTVGSRLSPSHSTGVTDQLKATITTFSWSNCGVYPAPSGNAVAEVSVQNAPATASAIVGTIGATKTATAAVTDAPAVVSVLATFTALAPTAVVHCIDGPATVSAVATYTPPNRSTTVNVTDAAATASTVATFVALVPTAVVRCTDGPATAAATVHFTPPTSTATVSVTDNAAFCVAFATLPKNIAAVSVTNGHASCSASATYTPRTATVACTTRGATCSASATFTPQPDPTDCSSCSWAGSDLQISGWPSGCTQYNVATGDNPFDGSLDFHFTAGSGGFNNTTANAQFNLCVHGPPNNVSDLSGRGVCRYAVHGGNGFSYSYDVYLWAFETSTPGKIDIAVQYQIFEPLGTVKFKRLYRTQINASTVCDALDYIANTGISFDDYSVYCDSGDVVSGICDASNLTVYIGPP